jgi:large subunit ribosomal protein L19
VFYKQLKNISYIVADIKKKCIFATSNLRSKKKKKDRAMKNELIQYVEDNFITTREFPKFKAGDTVNVSYRIVEGSKERIQNFQGVVLQIKGSSVNKTFTVRKISGGIGVERVFPFTSPMIADLKVVKRGVVRRARIYYLRNLTGKKARIKERRG